MRPGEARANLRGASRVLARIAIANANGSYRRAGERSNRAETEGEALKLVADAVLELLASNGADLDAPDADGGATALHAAVRTRPRGGRPP